MTTQTILGAGGPIADELARELHRQFTSDIRLVSRNPRRVNTTDQLVAADLMDPAATSAALAGSETAYLTVGLPMDSAMWEQKFPTMMANVLAAAREHGTRLVFFDNTYMYPRTTAVQTESTTFAPIGARRPCARTSPSSCWSRCALAASRPSSRGPRSSTGRATPRA